MSIISPTLIPRLPLIPLVLPKAPHFGPVPLPTRDRFYGRLTTRRDLEREMNDLSDEEGDLEESVCHDGSWERCTHAHRLGLFFSLPQMQNLEVRNRGFSWYIPIGRHATQLEEKNDAEDDSEGSESGQSGDHSPSANGEENDESGPDLDAGMEDMDEERPSDDVDVTSDDTEYEDEQSDV
ncbi:hypothetical protein PISMIDRAFT_670007 [Pisolithus microcarpus 441]|uniref:Uncharacterized protein n=1 Tax=Pisolithus microcarpus 441 TaxID=765257 RepID=A0A0C9Z0S3_9AGAM|nr:hypothetical protein PISMIDRAFT_670007 [Pisolithus microcarpus 441]